MKIICYLAGAIDNCNFEEIHGWRDAVKKELKDIDFIDPSTSPYTGKAKSHGPDIVKWDKAAINKSDVALVNCWRCGYGTAMEILYCHMIGKPTIVVASSPTSPWIEAHTNHLVSNLEQGILLLEEWLKSGIPYKIKGDPVNHPEHYTRGGIEVADFLEAKGLDQDFYLGNVIKYVSRGNFKGKLIEDLQKAKWYLERKIQQLTTKED